MLSLLLIIATAFAGDLYPVEDADALALRRIESEALAMALKKSGGARERYARTVVVANAKRMSRLPPDMVAFETALEREGADGKRVIRESYPIDTIQERALDVGWAKGQLLDDLAPGWRDREGSLNELLADAVAGAKGMPLEEDFRGAEEEVAALKNARSLQATQYMTRPGATLRFVMQLNDGAGPLDAVPLQDGARLFTAPTRFTGPPGVIETEAGVWVGEGEIRITGLDREEVQVSHDGSDVLITAPGVQARLTGAMYSWGATTLIIELADGARAEADPAVFTLFTLATAAGRMGAPVVLSEELRARGARCRTEMARYRSLARRDDRGLHGLLAQTVLLGPPPTFARDRDPDLLAEAIDGQFVELSSVLSSFWRCADLQPLWEEHRPEWIDAGQRELAAATRPLQEARSLDPERWPDVRIVPSLLDNPGTVSAVSWGNEVSVFVGPHGRQSDPGVLVQEALQHAVTGVLSEQSCPAVDEAHAAVASRPAVQDGVDRWLAANIARALTIQSGVLPGGAAPEEAVQGWTDEGFTLVPGVLAGLKRMPWDVWVTDLCGWDTPADDL